MDTVNQFSGGMDENSAEEMTQFCKMMSVAALEANATILAIHHTGKNSKLGPRGSSVFKATINAGILLERPDDLLPELTVKFDKLRDAEGGSRLTLKLHPVKEHESAVIAISHAEVQRQHAALQEAVRAVETHGPLTIEQAHQHVRTKSETATKNLLREATRQGLIVHKQGTGRGNPTTYSAIPNSAPRNTKGHLA